MGLLNRKNSQTTVSVRMALQADLLKYAELLGRSPSTLANDVLEGTFAAISADEPERSLVVVDLVRQALGKDSHRKLSEEYHRKLYGTQSHGTERAVEFARGNASKFVPLLKAAKQKRQSYDEVRPKVFGCLQSEIVEEIGALYETEMMTRAAEEKYDSADARDFFAVMVQTTELFNKLYNLFLKDHLSREVVREVPRQFLPP